MAHPVLQFSACAGGLLLLSDAFVQPEDIYARPTWRHKPYLKSVFPFPAYVGFAAAVAKIFPRCDCGDDIYSGGAAERPCHRL